ncbi:hypothetical protein ESCOMMO191M_16815 [Escherichia coli]
MGRRRSHERRDLPPNLYIRNNGYYCYRDPRTGKEFGLGRDRRIAITEAIQANIELFSGHKHKPLTARINSDNSVTLHSWLDRYEKILASRGIKQKTLINYMSKIKPRFYVSTSKSIIKALINMHSFEIQLSPIG